jgi:hypothetical protein
VHGGRLELEVSPERPEVAFTVDLPLVGFRYALSWVLR